MRIALVSESFLPDRNPLADCVLRVANHLVDRGHQPVVLAPQPSPDLPMVAPPLPFPLIRVPSVALPGYPQVRLCLPSRIIEDTLRAYAVDVVHLAGPVLLGAWAADAARRCGIPVVAVHQVDWPDHAGHGLAPIRWLTWRWLRRIYARASRVLVHSITTHGLLDELGLGNVRLCRTDRELIGHYRATCAVVSGPADRPISSSVRRASSRRPLSALSTSGPRSSSATRPRVLTTRHKEPTSESEPKNAAAVVGLPSQRR